MGLPKALTNLSYDFLQSQDGYCIRIITIQLSKHLDSPLTPKINEDGVRDFINDMEHEIIYIDKAGLEDLITFHEAEYGIVGGYYFNEGRDSNINNVIRNLYALRLENQKRQTSCTGCC